MRRSYPYSHFKGFWTPAFAGMTVYLTFYEIINFQSTVIGRFITEAGAFAAINEEPFEPAEDFAEEIEGG
jgi:hypothetical protein